MGSVNSFQVEGDTPPWTVTGVDKFITGSLARVERAGGDIPETFYLSICPWGERNALGGTPEKVQDIIDPRLRLVHFTGCGRPYLVILFMGAEAAERQQVAMQHLPWSEHFLCLREGSHLSVQFQDAIEDLWGEEDDPDPRTLRELLHLGELERF